MSKVTLGFKIKYFNTRLGTSIILRIHIMFKYLEYYKLKHIIFLKPLNNYTYKLQTLPI